MRLQTTGASQFKGPLECLTKTIRFEGIRGLYKGATPPLVGWTIMDSILLGSMHRYRSFISRFQGVPESQLSLLSMGTAGMFAGWTVCIAATPIEHIKARLQVQYSAIDKVYSGPIDCVQKIYRSHGVRGLYKGFCSTLLYRSNFFVFWGTAAACARYLNANTNLSSASVNFWSGGLGAQAYWLTAYPFDAVKQRIMTDNLDNRRYKSWQHCVRSMYAENGVRTFWRGFLPCFLRAFPTNACALLMFDLTMSMLSKISTP